MYALDVKGDQCGTPEIEGGVQGDTINFKVGNYWASETAKWQSGTNVHLDLNASVVLRQKFLYHLPRMDK